MRKLSIMALIVMTAATFIYSQSITVHRPNAADKWKTGEAHDIVWIKPGVTDPVVKITLWAPNQTTPVLVIASDAPNTGYFKWTIPYTVQTGKYRVKVKVKDKNIGGISSIFEIKKEIQIVRVPPKILGIITIIQPTSGTDWETGSAHQIEWNNSFTKNKEVKIELFNYNGTQLVSSIATVKKVALGSSTVSSHSWTIPHDVYKWPGNYTVKITNTDGTASGTSKMFHISRKTETKVYTIPVSTVNKYRWHEHDSRSGGMFGGGKKFVSPPGEFQDPGPGKMRIGFQNYYDSSEYHKHYVYRSFLAMNIDAYKGKGLLLKATLKYNFTNNLSQPAALGPFSLYYLEQAWNGSPEHLFTVGAEKNSSATNVTAIVKDWLLGTRPNHGMIMAGPNEQMQNNNDFCISISNPVTLELEILETPK